MNSADDYCLLQMRNKSKLIQPVQCNQIDVFIRLVNNKSIKIKMPSTIEVDKIKQIVFKHFMIPVDSQIIYIKGEALTVNKVINLQAKTIIHVTNTQQMEQEELNIFIIRHQNNSKKEILIIQECKTSKSTVILEFLTKLLSPSDKYDVGSTKVIESGRFLSIEKTFEEQKIQIGTQIHLILYQKKAIKQPQDKKMLQIEFQEIVLRRSRQNSLAENKNIVIPLPNPKHPPPTTQFTHNQSHFNTQKQENHIIKMTKKVKSASPLTKSQSHQTLKKPPQLSKLTQIYTSTKQSASSDRSNESCPHHPYQKIKKYQVPAIKKQCVRVCNCKPKRKAHGMLDQMMVTVAEKKPNNPQQRTNSGKKPISSSSLNTKIKNKLIKV